MRDARSLAWCERGWRPSEVKLSNDAYEWIESTESIEPTLADDKYYLADRHHLNDAGHALLGKVLGPIVVKIARAAHRSSRFW